MGETLLDHTSKFGPKVSYVRSTLLSSSIETLKTLGYYERYLELLPEEHHDTILLTLAPTWHPIGLAMAHYHACDELGLAEDELRHIGESVSGRIMGTFLGTVMRSSRNAGASPWIALKKYDKLWDRLMQGGGVRVYEEGPKDAIVETHGLPLLEHRYFMVAYAGVIKGATGMFAKTVHVNPRRPPDRHAARTSVSWV